METRLHGIWIAALCLGGCAAQADVLRRDERGGELSMHGPLAFATAQAREFIVEHCAGRYELLTDTGTGQARVAPANQLEGRGKIRYACARPAPLSTAAELATLPTQPSAASYAAPDELAQGAAQH